jgi:Zn-dependent M28 family amino/carboxypeptidase
MVLRICRIVVAVLWLVSFPVASMAEGEAAPLWQTARELRDGALEGTGAYELVRSLTVEVGPRLAGSPGDRAAVRWAEAKLQGMGFDEVRLEPVTVPYWERRREEGAIVAPYPQPVHLCALGGSVATPPEGIEAEVVRVESLEALQALEPEAVEGKIVFIDVGKMERTQAGSGYRTAVQPRGRGAAVAAPLGAVAVLIRSAGSDDNRTPHTGGMRYAEGVKKIPAAALSNPDADLLTAQVASGEPVRFRLLLDIVTHPDQESHNVIAEVRGREFPEEIVLIGCHLDSWDLGTGAVDDGAGCAVAMEVGQRIAALPQRPRRTVRVVLFANEEFGLSGALAYGERHAGALAKHRGAVEADLGAGRVYMFRSRVAEAQLPTVRAIADLLQPLGIDYQGNEAGGGADLRPLREAGRPLFDLRQDATYYFDWHHTANDTLDKVDPAAVDQNVAAHAVLVWVAAEVAEGF